MYMYTHMQIPHLRYVRTKSSTPNQHSKKQQLKCPWEYCCSYAIDVKYISIGDEKQHLHHFTSGMYLLLMGHQTSSSRETIFSCFLTFCDHSILCNQIEWLKGSHKKWTDSWEQISKIWKCGANKLLIFNIYKWKIYEYLFLFWKKREISKKISSFPKKNWKTMIFPIHFSIEQV